MRNRIYLLWTLLLLVSVPTSGALWNSYAEIEGRYGDFRQGGGARFFVPLTQDDRGLVFSQTRLYRMKNQYTVGSGVGYRQLCGCTKAFGVNGFFDYSRTDKGVDFVQLTAGAEVFGPCFEGRVNTYWPIERNRGREIVDVNGFLEGVDVFATYTTTRLNRSAFRGFDAEAGYYLPFGPGYLSGHARFFYFDTPKLQSMYGPHLRLHYEMDNIVGCCGSRVYAGVEWQYDRVRKTEAAVVAGFRIPFGCGMPSCCRPCGITRLMGNPVWREYGVTVLESDELVSVVTEPVLGPEGDQLQVIFFEEGAAGAGTQADPASVAGAWALSNPGDALFALADGGNIDFTGTFVEDFQQLLGFGDNNNKVIDFGGGVTIDVAKLNPGGRPTLTGTGDIIPVANGNTLMGFKVLGGDRAILADTITDLHASDIIIEASKRAIEAVDSLGTLAFDRVFITNTETTAVVLLNLPDSFAFKNGLITTPNLGADSFPLQATNVGKFTFANNTVSSFTRIPPTRSGLYLQEVKGDIAISNNTFSAITNTTEDAGVIKLINQTCDFSFNCSENTFAFMGPLLETVIDVQIRGPVLNGAANIRGNTIKQPAKQAVVVSVMDGASTDLEVNIRRNFIELFQPTTMIQGDRGVLLSLLGNDAGSAVEYVISNNEINNAAVAAIGISKNELGNASRTYMNGTIGSNTTINSTLGVEITALGGVQNDFLGATIENNLFVSCSQPAVSALNGGQGKMGPIILNNFDNSGAGTAAYQVTNVTGLAPNPELMSTCATIMGNNSERQTTMDIDLILDADAGTLQVVSLETLSADNSNISVNITGDVTTTTSCPVPNAP